MARTRAVLVRTTIIAALGIGGVAPSASAQTRPDRGRAAMPTPAVPTLPHLDRAVPPALPALPHLDRATPRVATAGRSAGIRPIAVAKWSAAAGAAAAAAYGFIRNAEADDLFRDLEEACEAAPAVCALREPDGAYADPGLEAMYQDVLTHDRASRYALVASQIGIAVGVALFLLDLRPERPPDIPYEPRRFEIGPAADGGLSFRARVPVGF
jgi:hypothetical protein